MNCSTWNFPIVKSTSLLLEDYTAERLNAQTKASPQTQVREKWVLSQACDVGLVT